MVIKLRKKKLFHESVEKLKFSQIIQFFLNKISMWFWKGFEAKLISNSNWENQIEESKRRVIIIHIVLVSTLYIIRKIYSSEILKFLRYRIGCGQIVNHKTIVYGMLYETEMLPKCCISLFFHQWWSSINYLSNNNCQLKHEIFKAAMGISSVLSATASNW